MFVSDCFSTLKQGKKVPLKQIGTLYYDWAADLVFEQDKTLNYNADAFGLCDFTPDAVLRSKTKDEIKAEIEQQQKDKNTPVTVDEKAVHEHDKDDQDEPFDDDRRGLGWLWVLLGLLLLAGVGYGLHYFKVVVLPETNTWKTEVVVPQEQQEDTLAVPQQPVEVVQEPELEPKQVQQPEPVVATPEANIRIIAGCFDQEENAIRLVNSLKSKGYQGAFYELRNTRWFVSFGRYANDEEATTALREIRANTEYKAWILK